MKPGVNFAERIDEAVGSCDALLAVIGKDWMSVQGADGGRRIDEPRDWVRLEIGAALERDILIVPVLVENARMPTEDELPDDLRPLAQRNAMDLSDRRWREDTENLLAIIGEVLTPEPEPAPATPPVEAGNKPGPAGRPSLIQRLSGLPALAKLGLGLLPILLILAVVGSLLRSDDSGGDSGPSAAFSSPQSLALDGAGNLFVADPDNSAVFQVSLRDGSVIRVEGEPPVGPDGEQVVLQPWAVASAGGSLYVAGEDEGGILRRGPDGAITRVLARAAGRDLPGASAIVVDGEGRLVVATDREVFRIGPDGSLAPVAGGPTKGFGGDGGPATAAKLDSPSALAYGPDAGLFIADSGNRRVRRVGPDGTITTVAGTGSETLGGDGGPAVEAGLGKEVFGLAVDRQGNVYLAAENQVRRIGTDRTINRYAGHPENESGSSGDGGPALVAGLNGVHGLAVAADGTLYLADAGNQRVRRVDPAGVITTVA